MMARDVSIARPELLTVDCLGDYMNLLMQLTQA